MPEAPEAVRSAVARLMGDYVYAVDDRSDPDAVVSLFTEDALIDFSSAGFPRLEGVEEIREFYNGLFTNMAMQFHDLTNFRLSAWDGTVAKGEAYVLGMGHPKDGDDIVVQVKYRMECVETIDGWKCRSFDLHPMMPIG